MVHNRTVAARDDLAGYAWEEGQAALAGRIAHLRRPTHGAWVLNQLVREYRREAEDLARLGETLRQAQAERSGDRMRAATAQRREIVQSLMQHTRDLTAQRGVRFSDEVERQVSASLEAALCRPTGRRPIRGRLPDRGPALASAPRRARRTTSSRDA